MNHFNMIKVGSDFSGVGAFNQALNKSNINYETIFACDMDKYARETYIANYGEPKYYPENVYDREIPKEPLDIYMTSPPCQAFSLAGKRKGEADKRGVLFYNSHEFIVKNKPRYFIFENVKGLLSDAKGRTFQIWLDMLGGKTVNGNPVIFPREDATPYHIYYKVFNAKNYGVPQNRERVFIIGIRDDADNTFTWPKPFHLTKRLKDVLEDNVDEKYYLSDKMLNGFLNKKGDFGNRFSPKEEDDKTADCITARYYKMAVTDNYLKLKSETKKDNVVVCEQRNDEGLRFFKNGVCGAVRTIDSGGDKRVIEKKEMYKIRRLTPRECFRLMDFPDTFTWPVSNSQAYKQAGNTIVVNVLKQIIIKLKF